MYCDSILNGAKIFVEILQENRFERTFPEKAVSRAPGEVKFWNLVLTQGCLFPQKIGKNLCIPVYSTSGNQKLLFQFTTGKAQGTKVDSNLVPTRFSILPAPSCSRVTGTNEVG